MRKLMILLVCVFTVSTAHAKDYPKPSDGTTVDSPLIKNVSEETRDFVFRLYPTQNMWTFLKLNTRNGKIWQVQYDIESDNRFEVFLNFVPLVTAEKEVNGRFTLYPTENFYTYILLDQLDGNMWQVQWSIEAGDRLILPIK